MRNRYLFLIIILALSLTLSACDGRKQVKQKRDPVLEALDELERSKDTGRQDRAIGRGFTIKTDQLMASKTFALYAKKGEVREFDATGKLVESGDANDFQNGENRWTITGTNTALTFGNLGSAEVELIRDDRSLTFIETTPVGNKIILIIYDEWSEKEKGFRCVYTRNLEYGYKNTLRLAYSGIAKVD